MLPNEFKNVCYYFLGDIDAREELPVVFVSKTDPLSYYKIEAMIFFLTLFAVIASENLIL